MRGGARVERRRLLLSAQSAWIGARAAVARWAAFSSASAVCVAGPLRARQRLQAGPRVALRPQRGLHVEARGALCLVRTPLALRERRARSRRADCAARREACSVRSADSATRREERSRPRCVLRGLERLVLGLQARLGLLARRVRGREPLLRLAAGRPLRLELRRGRGRSEGRRVAATTTTTTTRGPAAGDGLHEHSCDFGCRGRPQSLPRLQGAVAAVAGHHDEAEVAAIRPRTMAAACEGEMLAGLPVSAYCSESGRPIATGPGAGAGLQLHGIRRVLDVIWLRTQSQDALSHQLRVRRAPGRTTRGALASARARVASVSPWRASD